ncbi:endonuclease/exonuclease/phosphatase family protein [Prosthecomicrobium sp. N25]|uniref:endonuclease/exonuclease/phosphatase family protein n=1 Tax=Prosthecomicrobium sp. N25 TaxID=3129254 RepID=UPI003077230C
MTRTVPRIEGPSLAARQAIVDGPVTPDAFGAAFADLEVLHVVEQRPSPRPATAGDSLRLVFWNAERLKFAEASAAMLAGAQADVLILCEVDVGMARSGQRHTVEDLAATLEAGYVFGVEFVELGLGDLRERSWHAGETNRDGLHGAAFVSRLPLGRPALARLETSGRWFDGAFHERRVGGRIILLTEVEVAGETVVLVTAHYESHTDAPDRLAQTEVMLDAIDAYAPGRPVLIGGDFNTATFDRDEKHDPAVVGPALARDPDRLVRVMPYEPMFDLLARRGYDWEGCNVMAPTMRTRPDGTPKPPFGKIDWLFSRGLDCRDPAVIPAVDAEGVAISDHEGLAVTVRPGRRP